MPATRNPLEMKNIVPSQNYRTIKSRKYIQLHCACELQPRLPENQLQNISPTASEEDPPKLGSHVLRTKTKLPTNQIPDSGLRSENLFTSEAQIKNPIDSKFRFNPHRT